jgi:hypothetical protein
VNEPVVKADRALRKKALLFVAAASVLGLALIVFFQKELGQLDQLARENPRAALEQLLSRLHLLALFMTLLFVPFSLYLLYVSIRTYRASRFPPPGTRVIRDTRVVTGRRARMKGIAGVLLAAAFLALALCTARLSTTIGETPVAHRDNPGTAANAGAVHDATHAH